MRLLPMRKLKGKDHLVITRKSEWQAFGYGLGSHIAPRIGSSFLSNTVRWMFLSTFPSRYLYNMGCYLSDTNPIFPRRSGCNIIVIDGIFLQYMWADVNLMQKRIGRSMENFVDPFLFVSMGVFVVNHFVLEIASRFIMNATNTAQTHQKVPWLHTSYL